MEKKNLEQLYNPTNFLYTKTYGIAPKNTTLTVRYLVGGGVSANVPSNVLNNIAVPSNFKVQILEMIQLLKKFLILL